MNYNAPSLKEAEEEARRMAKVPPSVLFWSNLVSALYVFGVCIFTYESFISVSLSVAMTVYLYITMGDTIMVSMHWVFLGFAVVTPMSISVGLAFDRRELALRNIAVFRSCAFQLYLAHASWDWGGMDSGRQKARIDWQEHADRAMRELIGIAEELCRFLTLPSFSRARHRVTPWGRQEAYQTVEVAYRLYDSLLNVRMSKFTALTEVLKQYGLPGNESARMRQWERFVGDAVEQLRILKTYRTPQALRSFARLFTVVLPAFYSPAFSQLAQNAQSLTLGISFAVLTSFALTALFESIYMLEDPFVAHLTLDGIDLHEELRVLHWHQLVNARQILFPKAPSYQDQFSVEFMPLPPITKIHHSSPTKLSHLVVGHEENLQDESFHRSHDSSYMQFRASSAEHKSSSTDQISST